MKDKVSLIKKELLQIIRKHPVELLLGFTFFVLAIIMGESELMKEMRREMGDVLSLFPMLILFIFILNQKFSNSIYRLLYYISYFLFIPFLFLHLHEFIRSSGYMYSLLVAFVLFVSYPFHTDNLRFARTAIGRTVNFFSSLLIGIAFLSIAIAICYSVDYIFDLKFRFFYSEYVLYSAVFCVIPFTFLIFDKFFPTEKFESSGIFNILFNFILSPALIIYTVILYVYFIKVVVMWELPMGNVAYMVFGFILCMAVGKLCQPLLKNRFYNWYYSRSSLVALPLLLMFWVGVCYRLNQYGITENRIYLVISGIVVTLFAVLFLFRRTSHYIYIAVTAMVLFSLFTFIPWISASYLDNRFRKESEPIEYAMDYPVLYERFYTGVGNIIDISGYNVFIKNLHWYSVEDKDIFYGADVEEGLYRMNFTPDGILTVCVKEDTVAVFDLNRRLQQIAARQHVRLTDSLDYYTLRDCVNELPVLKTDEVMIVLDEIYVYYDSVYKVKQISFDYALIR